ncbi:unnamed protein product, partial [Onchocerca ochengi]|uniref:Uncharacterized protein n=1 Tax=Onchocerca ochengi TaxID=42157 RepID=A0A182F0B6_ONCOC
MCCTARKIELPQLEEPLEQLKTLPDTPPNQSVKKYNSQKQDIQLIFPNGVVRRRNHN